jgi:hypothetical protein
MIRRLLDKDLVCRCAWMEEDEDWDGESLESEVAEDWTADEELEPRLLEDTGSEEVAVAPRPAVKERIKAAALASADSFERMENESLGRMTAEIHLGPIQARDDFAYCLRQAGTVAGALQKHAQLLRGCASHLRRLAQQVAARDDDVSLDGDTHSIGVEAPATLIDELVALDAAAD